MSHGNTSVLPLVHITFCNWHYLLSTDCKLIIITFKSTMCLSSGRTAGRTWRVGSEVSTHSDFAVPPSLSPPSTRLYNSVLPSTLRMPARFTHTASAFFFRHHVSWTSDSGCYNNHCSKALVLNRKGVNSLVFLTGRTLREVVLSVSTWFRGYIVNKSLRRWLWRFVSLFGEKYLLKCVRLC